MQIHADRHNHCSTDPPVSTGGLLWITPSKPRAETSGQERKNIAAQNRPSKPRAGASGTAVVLSRSARVLSDDGSHGEGGRFNAQNGRTEGNPSEASLLGSSDFFRSESALGPDCD